MTPAPTLTPREREVFDHVVAGWTDVRIGTLLQVSPRTIRFHVDNAKRKFGATNRPELVAKILRQESVE